MISHAAGAYSAHALHDDAAGAYSAHTLHDDAAAFITQFITKDTNDYVVQTYKYIIEFVV